MCWTSYAESADVSSTDDEAEAETCPWKSVGIESAETVFSERLFQSRIVLEKNEYFRAYAKSCSFTLIYIFTHGNHYFMFISPMLMFNLQIIQTSSSSHC